MNVVNELMKYNNLLQICNDIYLYASGAIKLNIINGFQFTCHPKEVSYHDIGVVLYQIIDKKFGRKRIIRGSAKSYSVMYVS